MRNFLEYVIPFICFTVIMLGFMIFGIYAINRDYEFLEKAINCAEENNTIIVFK